METRAIDKINQEFGSSGSTYFVCSTPDDRAILIVYGRQDDLAACLLTLGLVLYNLAGRQVASLGDYERQRQTSESERKRLDELINSAADMLCRAAGVFTYMSQTLLPNRDRSLGEASRSPLPIDLSQEMTEALSECVTRSPLASSD